jgi:hypothetical protein
LRLATIKVSLVPVEQLETRVLYAVDWKRATSVYAVD